MMRRALRAIATWRPYVMIAKSFLARELQAAAPGLRSDPWSIIAAPRRRWRNTMTQPIQIKLDADNIVFSEAWISGERTSGNPLLLQNVSYREDTPFKVFGDCVNYLWPETRYGFAPDPSCPWSLAHPVDFAWVIDDAGSDAEQAISYWWPLAPSGYVALGLCFNNDKPNPQNYWCVHEVFTAPTQTKQYWSDAGAGWHHNGDLFVPIGTDAHPDAYVPTVLLSGEGMENGMGAPMVIVNEPKDRPLSEDLLELAVEAFPKLF
jgi:hypothetical protein